MPSGSTRTPVEVLSGKPLQADAQLLGARLHQFDDLADGLVQVGDLQRGLAVLGEREHVHDEVVDPRLVLLDDRPPAPDDRLVLLVEAQVDQIAPATDALEDVLDVVREGGDGLPDRRQPLGLDLVVVEQGVLEGQPGLVADGDHQHELVLGELGARSLCAGGDPGERGARPGCPRRARPAWYAAPGSARRSLRGSGNRRWIGPD